MARTSNALIFLLCSKMMNFCGRSVSSLYLCNYEPSFCMWDQDATLWVWLFSRGSLNFKNNTCMLEMNELVQTFWHASLGNKSCARRAATCWYVWKDNIHTEDWRGEEGNPSTTWCKFHCCSHRRLLTAFCPVTQPFGLCCINCLSLFMKPCSSWMES